MRLHWVKRASAAAGKIGLKIEPLGAVTLIGRKEPSFGGSLMSISAVSVSMARKAQ